MITGRYASNCCMAEVELVKRSMLPRCPKCLKLTVWENTTAIPTVKPQKKAA
jgi:hypothetical protein